MIATLNNVSKCFVVGSETIRAVDGVDLALGAGEFACVYGSSGSGKTTLLNLAAGLDSVDSGTITVADTTLSESGRANIRLHTIGVVFQSNNLLPEFTALENVALPLIAGGHRRRDAFQTARGAMRSVGVEDLGDRIPERMSGGQRQRVGIARALAGERRLIVADEPTGALDSSNSVQLFELLRILCQTDRLSVLLATHDPLAESFADSVYVMVDGRIHPR